MSILRNLNIECRAIAIIAISILAHDVQADPAHNLPVQKQSLQIKSEKPSTCEWDHYQSLPSPTKNWKIVIVDELCHDAQTYFDPSTVVILVSNVNKKIQDHILVYDQIAMPGKRPSAKWTGSSALTIFADRKETALATTRFHEVHITYIYR